MPYGSQVEKALEVVSKLDIDMIAPSHGIIWRSNIPKIIKEYKKWAGYKTENKAIIIYDSMWGSTQKIAYAIAEGIQEQGISVSLENLKQSHISDIITKVLTSKMIIIGSPTLNNTMLPTMGGFLSYLKGLRPKDRIGFVFGSYGWGGQAVGEIENIIKELKWEIPKKSINLNFVPDKNELVEIKKIGNDLGKYLKK